MIAGSNEELNSHVSTPEQLERLLNSEEAIKIMVPLVRRQALMKLAKLKNSLQQITCSATWFKDCWSGGAIFPPSAPTTPMAICRCERCARQGKVWPAFYGAPDNSPAEPSLLAETADSTNASASIISYECHLESLDDWTAAQLPSSPSGIALRAIREGRIRLRRTKTKLGRQRHAGNF